MNTQTIGQWLQRAISQLLSAGVGDSAELDAHVLASHVLQVSRTRILAFPETPLSSSDITTLNQALARRMTGEPVAYITGKREFWSTELVMSAGALVPRADTEILVEKALELVRHAPEGVMVDLGTGTGAIAIAVGNEVPDRQLIAIERDAEALAVAHINISTHTQDNVTLIQASWLDAFDDHSIAMVLSNPPYLASSDPHLKTLAHEPINALVSGHTGLEDLEHIVKETSRAAMPGAPLILEHGCDQGADVRQLLLDYSYISVGTDMDLAGLERISFGITAKKRQV